jgi:GMP reductase
MKSNNYQHFDFNDITIIPKPLTRFSSRKEIILDELPLISAPMHSVISLDNISFNKKFKNLMLSSNMMVSIPRNVKTTFTNNEKVFKSISLDEFQCIEKNYNFFIKYVIGSSKMILVDIANGHMQKVYDLCKIYMNDEFCKKIPLMIGNIANPQTYLLYAKLGVHYCRLSIGSGDVCLTTSNTGVHYPIASLINECSRIKKENCLTTKIVADGGFKNYSDIIKAISLGADYVMIGSLLNKSIESDSYPYLFKFFKIKNKNIANFLFKYKIPLYKKHIGMSTKEIQKKWGNTKLKTSEGKIKWNKVEYNLLSWIENFKDYLKSTMSYSDSQTLDEFRKNVDIVHITENSQKRFNK